MDVAEAFATLELGEHTALTPEAIRRAYLRQVRVHSPERDPEGFRRVREAYELAREVGATRNWHGARVSLDPNTAPLSSAEPSPRIEQVIPFEPRPDPAREDEADQESKADADASAEGEAPELPPASAANVAELTEQSLRSQLQTALAAEDPPKAALILCELYARANISSELPPPQVAFDVAFELFVRNRPKRARRLCQAYAGYLANVAPAPLRPEIAARWQLLTELSALSTEVDPSVTIALASGLEAGALHQALPELRDEILVWGEDHVARVMQQHAPSLFSALWPAAQPVARRRKSAFGWPVRGSLFALFLASRLLSGTGDCGQERTYSPAPSIVSPRRASARADDFLDEPRPESPAVAPSVNELAPDSEQTRQLKELTATIERQYLGGQCDELRGSWPAYLRLVRAANGVSGAAAGYKFRQAQAISVCPELTSDLAEQP
jgi:hypothetical protein